MTAPTTPPAPEGVEVMFDDGEVVAVELQYVGMTGDGLHAWEAVEIPGWRPRRIVDISMKKMPAMTTVTLKWFAIEDEWSDGAPR